MGNFCLFVFRLINDLMSGLLAEYLIVLIYTEYSEVYCHGSTKTESK